MRIAGAHHGAAVLEDLHVTDVVEASQFAKLPHPGVNDNLDCLGRHGCERQVVARGKANHSAKARFGLGHQQTLVLDVETIRRGLKL